jgi:TPP-dependent pyruvate/acetoin dehydrogenase alpha subunit
MAAHRQLEPAVPWTQVETTDEDWDAADPHLLTSMYSQLVLIRTFEEYVLELAATASSTVRPTPASDRRAGPWAPCSH